MVKLKLFACLFISYMLTSHANQMEYFDKWIKSRRSNNLSYPRENLLNDEYHPIYIGPQNGLMEADKIDALPGQPEGVNFNQYSGHVTVDPKAGTSLFYYFAESPENSSTNPLVLWLNGGPGCSSLIGAMEEHGPFRVNGDRKTLFRNDYAWNNVANVIYLESPAGVGFSYSNKSTYNNVGDKETADESYTFLVNWLERFPQYKTRDFYITGESYAGHYVPQLAYKIILNNQKTNQTVINLKGIAIGNAYIDEETMILGSYDYFWTHALNSDETNLAINKHCKVDPRSDDCQSAQNQGDIELGDHIDIYNIYAPLCMDQEKNNGSIGSVHKFDPCTENYVVTYLNRRKVQNALHTEYRPWTSCSRLNWLDSPTTVLPIFKKLIGAIRVWIYSGDTDGRVPVTSSRYAINTFKLPIKTTWYPWLTNDEVAGYAIEYEGLVFATVRGAGHLVPSYQPERALTLVSSFLEGKLPPAV